ncbi:hypothetical protein Trco_000167 [Trichoderma cornu-damae]|uniref:Uncharacterized protein n=1 Tax=Trichoderma cornu-damae TaxID=654480 RepID=A0A9P8TZK2_9HYPO|nr:hypothetical protein Trco_000167 [Trichoderma cornu-damae]
MGEGASVAVAGGQGVWEGCRAAELSRAQREGEGSRELQELQELVPRKLDVPRTPVGLLAAACPWRRRGQLAPRQRSEPGSARMQMLGLTGPREEATRPWLARRIPEPLAPLLLWHGRARAPLDPFHPEGHAAPQLLGICRPALAPRAHEPSALPANGYGDSGRRDRHTGFGLGLFPETSRLFRPFPVREGILRLERTAPRQKEVPKTKSRLMEGRHHESHVGICRRLVPGARPAHDLENLAHLALATVLFPRATCAT